MTFKTGLKAVAIFALAVTILGQERVSTTQKTDELLSRQIALPEFNYTETTTVFQSALKDAKASGGVVISTCGAAQEKRNFVFSQKIALREFLTGIERSDLNYKWEIEDEVINLLPRSDVPELLDLSIPNFKVEQVSDYDALNILLEKPEVKRKMTELGLDEAVMSIHSSGSYNPEKKEQKASKISINRQRATFRQILNEIVKARGETTWIYTERRCGANAKQFSIYFI